MDYLAPNFSEDEVKTSIADYGNTVYYNLQIVREEDEDNYPLKIASYKYDKKEKTMKYIDGVFKNCPQLEGLINKKKPFSKKNLGKKFKKFKKSKRYSDRSDDSEADSDSDEGSKKTKKSKKSKKIKKSKEEPSSDESDS